MMEGEHIASAFDRDLETIQAQMMQMGGLVEHSISEAAEALVNHDLERAAQVRRGDKAIDGLEEQINQETARVIALRAPTASDLRIVLSIFRIASNLERIGDYSKNIAKRTVVMEGMPDPDGAAQALRRMARAVERMLKDALDSFIQRDQALAEDVRERDQEIDQMYDGLFRTYLTHMMEDPRNISPCIHLHYMAKNIERMGDHVTSIAEQVVYLVTGSIPDESRPKGDRTSFAMPRPNCWNENRLHDICLLLTVLQKRTPFVNTHAAHPPP